MFFNSLTQILPISHLFPKKMTTYGTIPTSTPPPEEQSPSSTTHHFISRAKDKIRSGLSTCRPWHQTLVSPSFPTTLNEVLSRITTNLSYFHVNYAILVVFVLFLSLLWDLGTLILVIIMIAAWLFLYFLREGPMVVYGRKVDDLAVLIGLCGATFLMLILTQATFSIGLGVGIGVLLVLVHAAFRGTDDLYFVDQNAGAGGATVAL